MHFVGPKLDFCWQVSILSAGAQLTVQNKGLMEWMYLPNLSATSRMQPTSSFFSRVDWFEFKVQVDYLP